MKIGCKKINLIPLSHDQPSGRSFVTWKCIFWFHQSIVVTFIASKGIRRNMRAKNLEVRTLCNFEACEVHTKFTITLSICLENH